MQTIYKILLFMKRKPGMSIEAFRDYYETRHAPLCAKYIQGVTRYVRRYPTPMANPENSAIDELPFDVVTELWFEDEKIFQGTVNYLSTSKMPDEVVDDEARLFDRSAMRIATVSEHDSTLNI